MLDFLPPRPQACPKAAAQLAQFHADWARAGRSLLDELSDAFAPWVHYQGDVASSAEIPFFYHRHDEQAGEEHGHFHVFMSPAGMPPGLSPLVLPELAVPLPADAVRDNRDRGMAAHHAVPNSDLCHIVGIGLDRNGAPLRLFTTNRWVTGETWYAAADVVAMLDRVRFPGQTLVERWLSALFRAFRPEIQLLLHERDAAIAAWRLRRRGGPSHEDRRLVTPSSRAIGLAPSAPNILKA